MSIDTLDDIEPPYREGEGDAFARQHAKPFDPADPQAMRELVKAHGHLTRDEAYALIDALEEARADGLAARAQYFKDRKGSAKRLAEPAITNGQQDIHEMVVADLRAQLEAAKAALRTFVDMQPGGNYRDDVNHTIWISAGQFRRARAVLAGKPEP